MNKNLSILSLLFGLFLCVTVFSACGGDDESSSGDNNGSGSIPQTSKHVAKIITEDGSRIFESTYTYDSQGRVIKVISTESATYENIRTVTTYQYGETVILLKEDEEVIEKSQSFNKSRSYAYTVENGRIVKYKDGSTIYTYSYDANNYLSSVCIEYNNESRTVNITWSNGNPIKAGNVTYSYSNYDRVKGSGFSLSGCGMNGSLGNYGYYGNTPRNLLSKSSNRSALTDEEIKENEYALNEWSYEYTFQDNYITKIIYTPTKENNKNHKTISTIIWE